MPAAEYQPESDAPPRGLLVYLLRGLGHLPFRLLQWLGGFLGWLSWLIPNKRRAYGKANIALAFPTASEKERDKLLRKASIAFGMSLFESLYVWAQPDKAYQLVREIDGDAELQQAWREGQGILAATPHLGNWEVLGIFFARHYPITAMYKPQKGDVDRYMLQSRQSTGGKLVPSNARGVKALLRALLNNEMAGILPDQDPAWDAGVFAPLFGEPANSIVLFGKLASRSKAPAFFFYSERLPRGRGFRVVIRAAEPGIDDADPAVAATAMNRSVEACILACPTQYWWTYPRYRRRPPGSSPVYH